MSFDLAVWYQPNPLTDEEVAGIYDRLTDGLEGVAPTSPAITAFVNDLHEVYPEDDDDEPWASGVYSTPECVLLAISWSRKNEVVPVVESLAGRHGLALYDPQAGVLTRPVTDRA